MHSDFGPVLKILRIWLHQNAPISSNVNIVKRLCVPKIGKFLLDVIHDEAHEAPVSQDKKNGGGSDRIKARVFQRSRQEYKMDQDDVISGTYQVACKCFFKVYGREYCNLPRKMCMFLLFSSGWRTRHLKH